MWSLLLGSKKDGQELQGEQKGAGHFGERRWR